MHIQFGSRSAHSALELAAQQDPLRSWKKCMEDLEEVKDGEGEGPRGRGREEGRGLGKSVRSGEKTPINPHLASGEMTNPNAFHAWSMFILQGQMPM